MARIRMPELKMLGHSPVYETASMAQYESYWLTDKKAAVRVEMTGRAWSTAILPVAESLEGRLQWNGDNNGVSCYPRWKKREEEWPGQSTQHTSNLSSATMNNKRRLLDWQKPIGTICQFGRYAGRIRAVR